MDFNGNAFLSDEHRSWSVAAPYEQGDHLSSSAQSYHNRLTPPSYGNTPRQLHNRPTGNATGSPGMAMPVSLTDIDDMIKPNSAEPWHVFAHPGDSIVPRSSRAMYPLYPGVSNGPASAIYPSPTPFAELNSKAFSDSGYQSGYHNGPEANKELQPPPSQSATRGQTRKPRSTASRSQRGRVTKAASQSRRRPNTGTEQIICHVIKPEKPGEECGRVLKNNSEAKKHKDAHDKPYRCKLERCKNLDKRFGTLNDLDRHQVGVHSITSRFQNKQGGYICVACLQDGIPESQWHWWPRRDNFKSHWERKHEDDWSFEDLLKQSWQNSKPGNAPSESGRASMSRVDQEEAHPSDFEPNNVTSGLTPPSASGPRLSLPDGRLASPMRNGEGGDYLAGIGLGPSVEPFGNAFPGSDYDFQDIFETNLSTLDNTNSVQTQGGFEPQYSMMGLQISDDRRMTTQSPQFAPQWDANTEQQSTIQEQQESWEKPVVSDKTLDESSASNPEQGNSGAWVCEYCGKTKPRECDLRKHLKRHTRPYGCTFPHCGKRLGSRNDWKRHEIKQHFLVEMWRCMLDRPDGGTCGRTFDYLNEFTNHLALRHGRSDLSSPYADHANDPTIQSMHLGRSGNKHFWCGFCQKLIRQPTLHEDVSPDALTLGAWERRFQHIGDHFDKNGCDIGDWVCIERNQPLRLFPADPVPTASVRSSKWGSKGKGGVAIALSDVASANVSFEPKSEEDSELGDDGIPLEI